jgi:hypothetical protein
MNVRAVVTRPDGSPMQGVKVEFVSTDTLGILDLVKTDNGGEAIADVSGPFFVRARVTGDRHRILVTNLSNYMNADYVVDSNGFGTHTALYGASGALAAAITAGTSAFIWVCSTHDEPTVTSTQSLDGAAANQVITIASGDGRIVKLNVGASISLYSTSTLAVAGVRIIHRNIGFSVASTFTANLFNFQQAGGTPSVELDGVDFSGAGTWRSMVINGAGTTGNLSVRRCTGTLTQVTTCGGTGATNSNLGFNGNTGSNTLFEMVDNDLTLTNIIFRVADTHTEPASRINISRNQRLTLSGYAFQMTFGSSVVVDANTIVAAYNGRLFQLGTTGGIDVRFLFTGNYVDMSGGGNSSRVVYTNNFTGGVATEMAVVGNSLRGPGGSSAAIEVGSSGGGTMVLEPNGFYNWGSNLTGGGVKTTFSGPVTFSGAVTLPGGYLKADGTVPLTANWNPGAFTIGNLDFTVRALGADIGSNGLTIGDEDFFLSSDGGGDQMTIQFDLGIDGIVYDRSDNQFLFKIGGTTFLQLDGNDARLSGSLRVGSLTAPTNTTDGDITGLRIFIGADAALLTGLTAQIAGALGLSEKNELRFYNGANSHYVGFKAGAPSADAIWTLPTADGSAGQAIVTDGNKVLSFADAGSGGGPTSIARSFLLMARSF